MIYFASGWVVNYEERFGQSHFLNIPEELSVDGAVGKFHLAAHILECFARFSINFMKGAGQLDGEILETLWSSLNKVSGSIRAMSKAHRREVLDDHMNDSNWKKLTKMGE